MSGTSSPEQRKKIAREYLAEREARNPKLTPSITFGNATPGRPNYTGNNMGGAREGDDQHKNYTGAGYQAQIRRVQP